MENFNIEPLTRIKTENGAAKSVIHLILYGLSYNIKWLEIAPSPQSNAQMLRCEFFRNVRSSRR